jgi:RNA polymerase sigma-54 factor
LELPTVELEERVRSEVLDNPYLEEGKEEPAEGDKDESGDEYSEGDFGEEHGETSTDYDSRDDYMSDDDIPDYKLQDRNSSKAEQAEEIPFSEATSFYEILQNQLNEREMDEHQRELCLYLIGTLDDDGLLRKPLENIADELAIYHDINTDAKELEKALKVIQDFDPAGIGARNLQECLRIQITRKNASELKDIELRIIDKCYDELTRKHWDKIKQRLGLTDELFDEAIGEIKHLNPRPGAALGETIGHNYQQIVPDFIVETDDNGDISLSLNNRNTPELHINREYRDLYEEHTKNKANLTKEAKEAFVYMKQKLDAAQGFIDAVKQRQHTLMVTMQTIIDLQRPFFLEGDESLLKPMILKDVAERAKLDISTVSRVSNSKYVQTNFGIFPLKSFFSDGYTTEDGEELSTRRIRSALKECVDHEDKKKPLTDDELAALLKEKGFPVARRTVAKYREQLHIPVARLRR